MPVNIQHINHIYFLGIGGIGMSALARYFHSHGATVSGYDRTRTTLTQSLENEGIPVHYTDDPILIPEQLELSVYTPAIPSDSRELLYLRTRQIPLLKRSEVLGMISRTKFCIAVAGSHGKTTTSTLIAHLLHASGTGCLAFLGGISKNYHTNFIEDTDSEVLVTEADEYDRSFLQLTPSIAIVTSVDPDHLDIYGSLDSLKSTFVEFIHQLRPGGILLVKEGLHLPYHLPEGTKVFTYGFNETADFYPLEIRLEGGIYHFRLMTPEGVTGEFTLKVPGYINVENACAALAVCLLRGIPSTVLQGLLSGYEGVVRRMDKRFESIHIVYIDDYAHHPKELQACIASVRKMYPGKKVTGIFQPHLFTRTRDLADEFAECLKELDQIILLEIYPAREEPLPGITSGFLLGKINHPEKTLVQKEELLGFLGRQHLEILLTLGAGDIDQFVEPIVEQLRHQIT
jgi:UDP-N-acetylmuramate--alanine ligase